MKVFFKDNKTIIDFQRSWMLNSGIEQLVVVSCTNGYEIICK